MDNIVKYAMPIRKKYGFDYVLGTLAGSDYQYARFECKDYTEYSLLTSILYRNKKIHVDTHFNCMSVTIVLIDEWIAWKEEQEKINAAHWDWWNRYHNADEETRRLMACGAIE